jgi:hypothetical protein
LLNFFNRFLVEIGELIGTKSRLLGFSVLIALPVFFSHLLIVMLLELLVEEGVARGINLRACFIPLHHLRLNNLFGPFHKFLLLLSRVLLIKDLNLVLKLMGNVCHLGKLLILVHY